MSSYFSYLDILGWVGIAVIIILIGAILYVIYQRMIKAVEDVIEEKGEENE